jgi:hypothetical protein
VKCGFSALVKPQHPFYFVLSSKRDGGTHEANSRWNSSDPRDPEPCRVCTSRQGQSSTTGRDEGLA